MRGAAARWVWLIPLLPLGIWLRGWGPAPAWAAEYRDPEGRFTLTLPEGIQEIDRALLQARLEGLRRGGVNVPPYAAAFDRGTSPRFDYPYALLEVSPVPGAAWTTADLEGALGKLNAEQTAQDVVASFDRLGLGGLMRDPRITFVRWEPERQAGVYRITTELRGRKILGAGRIYFYRGGYITLWCYYLPGTPYAELADRLTAGLQVLPAFRVAPPDALAGARPILIGASVGAMVILVGVAAWLGRRRRGASVLVLLAMVLAGCTSVPAATLRPAAPGGLTCMPSGYATVGCY